MYVYKAHIQCVVLSTKVYRAIVLNKFYTSCLDLYTTAPCVPYLVIGRVDILHSTKKTYTIYLSQSRKSSEAPSLVLDVFILPALRFNWLDDRLGLPLRGFHAYMTSTQEMPKTAHFHYNTFPKGDKRGSRNKFFCRRHTWGDPFWRDWECLPAVTPRESIRCVEFRISGLFILQITVIKFESRSSSFWARLARRILSVMLMKLHDFHLYKHPIWLWGIENDLK